MIRHLAGEVSDGVQKCVWCDVVLVEWQRELQPNLSSADARALFFKPGVELLDNNKGTITTALEALNVPRCIPEVEGVDIR